MWSVAGCGGGESANKKSPSETGVAFQQAIAEAQRVKAGDFPATGGRTLQQLAKTLPAINLGPATQTFRLGTNRFAFGLIDQANQFVYGKAAVYLARRPNGKARGPFVAPPDPLVVEPPFRSRGAATEDGEIAAIYGTRIELPKSGRWFALAMVRNRGKLYGGGTEIEVKESSPIPDVGDRPPAIDTDTLTSAGGDIKAIDTRVPPDDMHETSFRDVVGRKPVALLFATPALCQSRVCGPVTDIAAQLQKEYGDRVTFIHQEVYVDNEVSKGLRNQLRQFGLPTEPWLFTFGRDGRVAARVEGSFGNQAFRAAIEAALRQP